MKPKLSRKPRRRFLAVCCGVIGLLVLPACTVYDSYGFSSTSWGPGFGNQFVVGSTWNTLPVGYQTVFWNNNPYYVWGNHFFVRRGPRYVCVRRPAGPIYYRGGRRFTRHVPPAHIRRQVHQRYKRGRVNRGFNRIQRGPVPRVGSQRTRSNRIQRSSPRLRQRGRRTGPSNRANPRQPRANPSTLVNRTNRSRISSPQRRNVTPRPSAPRSRPTTRSLNTASALKRARSSSRPTRRAPTRSRASTPRPSTRRSVSPPPAARGGGGRAGRGGGRRGR